MAAPTCKQLMDEDGLERVQRTADDSWRHGSYVLEVFHRELDDTYWQAGYRHSTDGEANELREGTATIVQVKREHQTVTVYVPI